MRGDLVEMFLVFLDDVTPDLHINLVAGVFMIVVQMGVHTGQIIGMVVTMIMASGKVVVLDLGLQARVIEVKHSELNLLTGHGDKVTRKWGRNNKTRG